MRRIDDTARMLLMNFVTAVVTFAVAFGINLSNEQTGAIVGLAAIGINLLAYFFPAPPKPTILGAVAIFVLVFSLYAASTAPRAAADWDPGGGGYSGYYDPPAADPGPSDWTPCYWNGC